MKRCTTSSGPLLLGVCLLLTLATSCSSQGDAQPSASSSASAAELNELLDLTTFPLVPGAQEPTPRRLAALAYNAPAKVTAVFEFQRKALAERKFREEPGAYVTDDSASAVFTRGAYKLSVTAMPASKPGESMVMLTQHGNVALDALPAPADAKPLYAGPISRMLVSDLPPTQAADACRAMLKEKGWLPFGSAGDSQYYKQNGVRLTVTCGAAPGQGGKTVVSYSSELMSVDLLAPDDALDVRYADTTKELTFDTTASIADVVAFYRQALAKLSWQATLDKTITIGFKEVVIFRNPGKELLNLELHEFEGKRRVSLRHQSAAEVDEEDRRAKAFAEKRKNELNKPLPKLTLKLPTEAMQVDMKKDRVEFNVPIGKAKAIVDAWRKSFVDAGWKESIQVNEAQVGAASLTRDGQTLSLNYVDPGVIPAEVTLQASGVELAP